jgi:hypothetical protein
METANAALIVEAVNSHAANVARIAELEDGLRECARRAMTNQPGYSEGHFGIKAVARATLSRKE